MQIRCVDVYNHVYIIYMIAIRSMWSNATYSVSRCVDVYKKKLVHVMRIPNVSRIIPQMRRAV